ncbi:MAG: hypothetical protein IPH09_11315 [bacterium]|nr:hypothetical protein [bacterium]
MPRGKGVRVRLMLPCSTRVNMRFARGDGGPNATVRVMSVVPSRYWAPESIR